MLSDRIENCVILSLKPGEALGLYQVQCNCGHREKVTTNLDKAKRQAWAHRDECTIARDRREAPTEEEL